MCHMLSRESSKLTKKAAVYLDGSGYFIVNFNPFMHTDEKEPSMVFTAQDF